MKTVLRILYIAVGLFLLIFVEAFFVNLFAFRIIFLLFLFAYKKLDWKELLSVFFVISLIMDVTMHYKLGTNLLLFMIPLGVFSLFTLFSSVEDGVGAYIVRFFSIFLYYVLNLMLPSFLLTGTLGSINGRSVLYSFVASLFAILLLFLINYMIGGIRKRGSPSQIRLK